MGKTVYLGNSFRTSLAHWPVRLHQKTEQSSAQGTTGNALTFGKRHSLKSQWKRKGARPASTHSNGHRLPWFSSVGGKCYSETPAHNGHCFFLYLNCQKESTSLNATRHEIYRNRRNPPPLKSLPLALHVQRAHLQMLWWKVANKSDPPDVQLTDYRWEVKEHEHIMPAISREPVAPSKLVDVVSCSCKPEGKVCSGRCSYGSNGISCTSYFVCEGGMLAITHLLNRRRTKATHNRVKWILINLRGREWLIELMTVDNSPVIWHTVVTIRCLLNYCHRLEC